MALVDHNGRPFPKKEVLSAEIAKPSLTGVRQAWDAKSAVNGLTPDKLAAILRQANTGDMDAFLTLAEEMEERDPHYASVLSTRKLSVVGLDRHLEFAPGRETDANAAEILEACGELIEAPEFDHLVECQLDNIAKGYAATEIIWNTSANRWTPERYEWRDPRWFQFDRETGQQLRLRETGEIDGVELPPMKFAVTLSNRKTGLAARRGLARLVAFSFVCKLYGLVDWMAYAEIFGIPMRLGKYDRGALPEDVEVLKRAVFGLGSDAAAVIPMGMTIEFPTTASGTGSADLFEKLATFLDNQVSKAVLGQAGTTDMQKGGGYAQSKTLDGVRTDLMKADAKSMGRMTTRDVLAPFVAANWGPQAPVPRARFVVEEPEDIKVLSDALHIMVPLGLEVDQDEVRGKLNLTTPKAGAKLLRAPAKTEPDPAPEPPAAAVDDQPALTAEQRQVVLAAEQRRRARPTRDQVEGQLDEIILAELDGWERTLGAEVTAVAAELRAATSLEDFGERLNALAADLSAPAAARSMARAMAMGAVIGDAQARQKAD